MINTHRLLRRGTRSWRSSCSSIQFNCRAKISQKSTIVSNEASARRSLFPETIASRMKRIEDYCLVARWPRWTTSSRENDLTSRCGERDTYRDREIKTYDRLLVPANTNTAWNMFEGEHAGHSRTPSGFQGRLKLGSTFKIPPPSPPFLLERGKRFTVSQSIYVGLN